MWGNSGNWVEATATILAGLIVVFVYKYQVHNDLVQQKKKVFWDILSCRRPFGNLRALNVLSQGINQVRVLFVSAAVMEALACFTMVVKEASGSPTFTRDLDDSLVNLLYAMGVECKVRMTRDAIKVVQPYTPGALVDPCEMDNCLIAFLKAHSLGLTSREARQLEAFLKDGQSKEKLFNHISSLLGEK